MQIFISQNFIRALRRSWQMFLRAPECFWRVTVWALVGVMLCIVLIDAFIFWTYALGLERANPEPESSVPTLNIKNFQAALKDLDTAEKRLREARQSITVPDMF